MYNGPVLIRTTKEIRKKSPIRCHSGDQGAHLVGLNLAKLLLNYYSTERDIVVPETVIDQLTEDINDKSNFACETDEQNTEDKYTEEEVLDLLFHGSLSYDEMSDDAKLMFARLKQLIQTMMDHLQTKGESIEKLLLIQNEIESGKYPLSRHCLSCQLACHFGEETGLRVFCNTMCQSVYYSKQKMGIV